MYNTGMNNTWNNLRGNLRVQFQSVFIAYGHLSGGNCRGYCLSVKCYSQYPELHEYCMIFICVYKWTDLGELQFRV